eukprot:13425849-Ditylum_brightwellii.AAC.1
MIWQYLQPGDETDTTQAETDSDRETGTESRAETATEEGGDTEHTQGTNYDFYTSEEEVGQDR